MAFNFLRQKNIFDQFGQPVDDGSEDDYEPSTFGTNLPSKWTAPPVDDVPPGKEPQNPYVASLFRQSMEQDQPDSGSEPSVDWAKRMRALYQPKNEAQDRLNSLLNQFPEEEKPTFMRKLSASLAGVGKGGLKDAQTILDEPNRTALERFKAQADPYQRAAESERQGNVNERTLAQQTITAEQNQQKIDETERKNKATEANQRTRAEAYDFKARHPDWKIDFSGPNVLAVSPDGTQSVSLGPTGHMTEVDKVNLQNKGRVAAAEASGAAAIERARAVGDEARKTKETEPGKADTPKDDAARQANTMKEIYFSDPSSQKFFNKNPDGSLSLKKGVEESGRFNPFGWSSDDVDKYAEIVKKIFGQPSTKPSAKSSRSTSSGIDMSVPTNVLTPPNTSQRDMPETTEGQRLVVVSPTGVKKTIPASQVNDFLKDPRYKGWKQVF